MSSKFHLFQDFIDNINIKLFLSSIDNSNFEKRNLCDRGSYKTGVLSKYLPFDYFLLWFICRTEEFCDYVDYWSQKTISHLTWLVSMPLGLAQVLSVMSVLAPNWVRFVPNWSLDTIARVMQTDMRLGHHRA